MKELIEAVSHIELDPAKKYLLVFKGEDIDMAMLNAVSQHIRDMGVINLCLSIASDIDVTVVEAPEKGQAV